MASLVVRNLDDGVRARLRARVIRHGRSMAAEVRDILTSAVEDGEGKGETLADFVAAHFGPQHGFDLAPYLPARDPILDCQPNSVRHPK